MYINKELGVKKKINCLPKTDRPYVHVKKYVNLIIFFQFREKTNKQKRKEKKKTYTHTNTLLWQYMILLNLVLFRFTREIWKKRM